jgi:hypothetical protein
MTAEVQPLCHQIEARVDTGFGIKTDDHNGANPELEYITGLRACHSTSEMIMTHCCYLTCRTKSVEKRRTDSSPPIRIDKPSCILSESERIVESHSYL